MRMLLNFFKEVKVVLDPQKNITKAEVTHPVAMKVLR